MAKAISALPAICLQDRKNCCRLILKVLSDFFILRHAQKLEHRVAFVVRCERGREARHDLKFLYERVARSWQTPLFLSSLLISSRLVRS